MSGYGSNYNPFVFNADRTVHGVGGLPSPEDLRFIEKWKREIAEAEGPPLAAESEICKLLGVPPYNETDYASPWVGLRAVGFPRPIPPRIVTDPVTRKDSFEELRWDRGAVRQWLAHVDAVTASMQPKEKRHKHLR
jgi:hypothetical protein